MHEVKRWHCSYCTKVLSKKSDMAEHEKRCPRNPESKSCGTCGHFTTKSGVLPNGMYYEQPVCEIGQFEQRNRTQRNPYGMRSNCPCHVTDPYRFE